MDTWDGIDVKSRFLIIDATLGFFLFTPLIVLHFYGTSMILDRVVLEHFHPVTGGCILVGVGIATEFSAAYWQVPMRDKLQRAPKLQYKVATILYNYVLGFANVCHFRGVEVLYDLSADGGTLTAAQVLVTSTVLLWALKVGRNILGAPLSLGLDCREEDEDFFETSSYFGTEPNLSKDNLFDNLVTTALISSLVCMHWISLWQFLDTTIFPSSPAASMAVSWLSGYVIITSFLFMQQRAKRISENLESDGQHQLSVVFEDVFVFGANVGCILTWKAIWMFFQAFCTHFPIFRNSRDVTHLYANMASFGLLAACYLSSSVVSKGCEIDGESRAGEGMIFSMDYFGEFFKEQIEKELSRHDLERCEEEEVEEEEEEYDEEAEDEADIRRAMEDNAILNGTSNREGRLIRPNTPRARVRFNYAVGNHSSHRPLTTLNAAPH